MRRFERIKFREILQSLLIAVGVFILFGTVTALWRNPFFTRMTPVVGYEFVLLALESILMGLYFGVKRSACAVKTSRTGSVLGFLGIACPVCNKILLLLFGAGFLLTYFEPVRLYVGLLGIGLLLFALNKKLSLPTYT
jgi:hypothetical protein